MQRTMAAMGETAPDLHQLDPDEWAKRPDGTQKGRGFLGLLAPQPGTVMSELSVASDDVKNPDGSYADYPTLIPGLTASELQHVLDGNIPPSVYKKAEAHALKRRGQGKPLFAEPWEENATEHPEFRRLK